MTNFSRHTLIFLLVCLGFTAIAQLAPRDRVLLTDGTFYDGIVIEQKPGEHIRLLRLPESDTLTVALNDIDKLIRLMQDENPAPESQLIDHGTAGFFNTSDIVLMIHGWSGGGDYEFAGFGLGVAYRLKPRLETGLAVHYLGSLYSPEPDRYLIPLTATVRYRLSSSARGRFSSLAAINAGYGFTLNRRFFDAALETELEMSNGLYLNPALGFRMNVLNNAGLMLEIGYQMTTSNMRDTSSGETLRRKMWHNLAVGGTLFF